jgi:hypothetical protein
MPLSLPPRSVQPERTTLDRAEPALLEEYGQLVRLAYLTLPPSLSRHRRVLLAHSLVQRSLPGSPDRDPVPHPRPPRGTPRPSVARRDRPDDRVPRPAPAWGSPPRGGSHPPAPPRSPLPVLPVVWGFRRFSHAGYAKGRAPGRTPLDSTAAAPAAFVPRGVDDRTDAAIATLLRAAGSTDPEGALGSATRIAASAGRAARTLLGSREFDACAVRTGSARPTRRRQVRFLWGAVSGLVFTGAPPARSASAGSAPPAAGAGSSGAAPSGPADHVLTPGDVRARGPRVGLTARPTRVARADDPRPPTRVLPTGARPARAGRVTATAGTPLG